MGLIAFKCESCGYITIQSGNNQICMPEDDFNKEFPELSLEENTFGCCDACVNGYATDMCACGSKEHYEKCDNCYSDCGTPMQNVGEVYEKRQFIGWRF